MSKNVSEGSSKKVVLVLLALGIALTGLVVAAPTASAACVNENIGNGLVYAQQGGCDYTFVYVDGHRIA